MRRLTTKSPSLENPEPCVRRKPCHPRNSPPFGESSCLARVCPFAKSRRVSPPPFSSHRVRHRLMRRLTTKSPSLENPEPRVRRKPCQARNSPPFGGSSCSCLPLRKIPTRFPAPIFIPPREASPRKPTDDKVALSRKFRAACPPQTVPGSKFAAFWRIFVPGSCLPLRKIPTRFPGSTFIPLGCGPHRL